MGECSSYSFQQASQQLFPATGEFAVCETCRLGRGKCRRTCLVSEKIAGKCKLNFFCCRERI
ncbi:beta-defensin 35-like [Mastomys coucha]|uniref:beta-defensin 35-like n=1 Tax=Mastomys coucha TaxID=35658 RepID=UPI00126199C1|nr:beta-defensin 35-like [Mastomys coucha]